MNNDLSVITFANDHDIPMLKNLVMTLRDHNYTYEVIGKGIKWIGFMTKIKGYYDYAVAQPPDRIILSIDGYDMFCTGPPEELLTKYRSYNRPIVVGAETFCGANCMPVKKWWGQASMEPSAVRYCNSGFIMGRAREMTMMYKHMLLSGKDDDQLAACAFVEDYPALIALDVQMALVGNITPIDFHRIKWDVRQQRIIHAKNGEKPCFIHTPGRSGDFMIRTNYVGRSVLGSRYLATGSDEINSDYLGKVPTFFQRNFLWLLVIVLTVFVVFLGLAVFAPSLILPVIAVILALFVVLVLWYSKALG